MTPEQRRRYTAGLMAAQYDGPTPQDTTVTERAGLLPIGTYANGMTGLAFPGFLADPVAGFVREVTNPVPYLDRSEDEKRRTVETGFDVAGAAMVGGIAAPKPAGILGMAGGKMSTPESRPGAAAGAALNSIDNQVPGIRAYHGSPHDFDRFDMSKIGTGEGAQAYGHGLYFAENEGVAKSYKNALSGQKLKDGTSFDDLNPAHWAADAVNRAGGDRAKAAQLLAADMTPEMKIYDGGQYQRLLRAKGMLDRNEAVPEIGSGRMYEVNIKGNPEDFLDWDKPLSQQSAGVRDAINRVGRDIEPYGLDRITDDMRPVEMSKMLKDKAAIARLRDHNVAGVKYLDQGSRTAGEGTSNYVVFDDKLIEIIRKYGLLGMAGGAAVNEMLSGAQEQRKAPWSNAMLPGDA